MNRIYEIKEYYIMGKITYCVTANGNQASIGHKNKNIAIMDMLELCKCCFKSDIINDIEIDIDIK